MTQLKLFCLVGALLLALALPTSQSVNALSAGGISDAGRITGGSLTMLTAAKKRNVCDADLKYCLAQCKQNPGNLLCTELCINDHYWCTSVCGGKRC